MSSQGERTTLRRLAERAAGHPRIEQAVVGAIRQELPAVIEHLLREMVDEGGQLRLYLTKRPREERQMRDERVRALLEQGLHPDLIAEQVGCSRRHVYNVRRRLCKLQP